MPLQRITQRSLHASVGQNMQTSLARLQKLQEQLSSGKSVQRPSDAPSDAIAALRHRSEIRRSEQLQRNISDAQGWLATTDQAITSQLTIANRARELVLTGINGSMSPQDRAAIAEEIDGLRKASLDLANTTYLGRPIFAGTSASAKAYDASGTFQGDTGSVDRNVAPNVAVRVNAPGPEVFGPVGDDFFGLLADIADHLRNDPGALQGDLGRVDTAFTRLTNSVASIGARARQVDNVRERLDSSIIDATNRLAEVESIDLPATIVALQLQEVAYQSALSATARVVQPSLMDFLR